MSDGNGGAASRALAVAVGNVEEAPLAAAVEPLLPNLGSSFN